MPERLVSIDVELVNFIQEHMARYGIPPTVQQIADHLGYQSRTYAHTRLTRLIQEGVIERTGVSRGIRVNQERLNEMGGQ